MSSSLQSPGSGHLVQPAADVRPGHAGSEAVADECDASRCTALVAHDSQHLASGNVEPAVVSLRTLQSKMIQAFKEVIIMALVCVVYATIRHDPPKVSRGPVAFPFFPKDSIVQDYYKGHMAEALDRLADYDVAFVMYYAPWDAESQSAREQFELAARYMRDTVAFSAVNCWQPASECRVQYSKVFGWPVLVAYTAQGKALQYNGPKTAAHMIKFLHNVMYPYMRVNTYEDVHRNFFRHDAFFLAAIDVSPGSADFGNFYMTSLKFLERDPFREIGFGVMAKHPDAGPFISLLLWNETLIYPEDGEYTAKSMTNWIVNHWHQVTTWLTPSGQKSLQLSSLVQGALLMLFTPNNPLLDTVDHYSMLKEVALEYSDCNDNNKIQELLNSTRSHRKAAKLNFTNLLKECSPLRRDYKETHSWTVSPSVWTNLTQVNDKNPQECSTDGFDCSATFSLGNLDRYSCHQTKKLASSVKTSMVSESSDSRSASHLLTSWKNDRCKMLRLAHRMGPVLFVEPDSGVRVNITGMACRTNVTITPLLMDSLRYHHFAEAFDVDVLQLENKTAMILVDPKQETHYVYEGPLSTNTLREFVLNYTEHNLSRSSHSSFSRFKHTHIYREKKDCNATTGDQCIRELDSASFLPAVMTENKVVIVFYYSKQCSHCSGLAYVYLSAAKLLGFVDSIMFARVDGDLNTLPWEYTMEAYPTLLLFPAKRKSESRAFPQDMAITVPNLVGFILTNLQSTLRLNVMWSICKQTKHKDDKLHCLASLRVENLSAIENTLREWRSAEPRKRRSLLYRLQQLRSLHLSLAVAPSDEEGVQRCLRTLERSETANSQRELI